MEGQYGFQIRVGGVLTEGERILLVKQRVSGRRGWSLPGGRAERGESLEQAIRREMKEETGLDTAVESLLYLCDVPGSRPPVVHVTFALKRLGGRLCLPTNAWDENPIRDVRFVPFDELEGLGFGPVFVRLCREGFPNRGAYLGEKANIGLLQG